MCVLIRSSHNLNFSKNFVRKSNLLSHHSRYFREGFIQQSTCKYVLVQFSVQIKKIGVFALLFTGCTLCHGTACVMGAFRWAGETGPVCCASISHLASAIGAGGSRTSRAAWSVHCLVSSLSWFFICSSSCSQHWSQCQCTHVGTPHGVLGCCREYEAAETWGQYCTDNLCFSRGFLAYIISQRCLTGCVYFIEPFSLTQNI